MKKRIFIGWGLVLIIIGFILLFSSYYTITGSTISGSIGRSIVGSFSSLAFIIGGIILVIFGSLKGKRK